MGVKIGARTAFLVTLHAWPNVSLHVSKNADGTRVLGRCRSSSGSLAIFAAIRRASSFLS